MPEVVTTAPGTAIVWAIGVSECGEPVGVWFINRKGVPRWVPLSLADSTDTATVRLLAKANQLSTTDVCEEDA